MTKVKPSSEVLRLLNHYIVLNLREIERKIKNVLYSDEALTLDTSKEVIYVHTKDLHRLVDNIERAREYAWKEYRKINKLDD